MSRVITYTVHGMHCASCEKLLADVLDDVSGVQEVEISVAQGRAAVRMADGAKDPDVELLNKQLSEYGYHVTRETSDGTAAPSIPAGPVCAVPGLMVEPFWLRLGRAVLALMAVGLIAFVIGKGRALAPSIAAGASVGALFALGLVASVSTCLASTGGFLLAYAAKAPSRLAVISSHVGRLAAFMLGGALLGAIGGRIPAETGVWYGVVALALGIGFLVVGLSLLQVAPSWSRLGLRLPSGFQRFADRVTLSRRGMTPFLVGAVTFILPCGFTQTAQALALASGSAQKGLLYMAAFALGTLPVLLGLTLFGSVSSMKSRLFRFGAGAALVLFAIGQIDGGLTVLGSPWTFSSIMTDIRIRTVSHLDSSVFRVPPVNAQEQVVRMTVAYGTYQPQNLSVKKGIPVRWEIDGKDISGCADTIVAPTIGVDQPLQPGLNIVRFTPKKTGRIPFSCSMGMIRGSFMVFE